MPKSPAPAGSLAQSSLDGKAEAWEEVPPPPPPPLPKANQQDGEVARRAEQPPPPLEPKPGCQAPAEDPWAHGDPWGGKPSPPRRPEQLSAVPPPSWEDLEEAPPPLSPEPLSHAEEPQPEHSRAGPAPDASDGPFGVRLNPQHQDQVAQRESFGDESPPFPPPRPTDAPAEERDPADASTTAIVPASTAPPSLAPMACSRPPPGLEEPEPLEEPVPPPPSGPKPGSRPPPGLEVEETVPPPPPGPKPSQAEHQADEAVPPPPPGPKPGTTDKASAASLTLPASPREVGGKKGTKNKKPSLEKSAVAMEDPEGQEPSFASLSSDFQDANATD